MSLSETTDRMTFYGNMITSKEPIIKESQSNYKTYDFIKETIMKVHSVGNYLSITRLLQKLIYMTHVGISNDVKPDIFELNRIVDTNLIIDTPNNYKDYISTIRHILMERIKNMYDYEIICNNDEYKNYINKLKFEMLNIAKIDGEVEYELYMSSKFRLSMNIFPKYAKYTNECKSKKHSPQFMIVKKYENFNVYVLFFSDKNIFDLVQEVNNIPESFIKKYESTIDDKLKNGKIVVYIDIPKDELYRIISDYNKIVDEYIDNNIDILRDLLYETIDTFITRSKYKDNEYFVVFMYNSERELLYMINQFLKEKGEKPIIKNIGYTCINDSVFLQKLSRFMETYIDEFTRYYFSKVMKINIDEPINIDVFDNKFSPTALFLCLKKCKHNKRSLNIKAPFLNTIISPQYNSKISMGFAGFNLEKYIMRNYTSVKPVELINPIYIKNIYEFTFNFVNEIDIRYKNRIYVNFDMPNIIYKICNFERKYIYKLYYSKILDLVFGKDFINIIKDEIIKDLETFSINDTVKKLINVFGDYELNETNINNLINAIRNTNVDNLKIILDKTFNNVKSDWKLIKDIIKFSHLYRRVFPNKNSITITGDEIKSLLISILEYIKFLLKNDKFMDYVNNELFLYDDILADIVRKSTTIFEAISKISDFVAIVDRLSEDYIKPIINPIVNVYSSIIINDINKNVNKKFLFTTGSISFPDKVSKFRVKGEEMYFTVSLDMINSFYNNYKSQIKDILATIVDNLFGTPVPLKYYIYKDPITKEYRLRSFDHKHVVSEIYKIMPYNAINKLLYVFDIMNTNNVNLTDLFITPMIIYNKIFKSKLNYVNLSKFKLTVKKINKYRLNQDDRRYIGKIFSGLLLNI